MQKHEDGQLDKPSSGYDHSIANPARMQPKIREAVCQQCHLAGVARVVKTDKSRFDFRPGTPLEDTIATYVLNPNFPQNENHFVGQVEQIHASRCFTASNGELGCISCHDPHSVPPPETKVAFYRERCLTCHEDATCSETTDRRDENGDNCIACHMPPMETNVRHASTTDHRVPRTQSSTSTRSRKPGNSSPIIAFPSRGVAKNHEPLEADRDAMIALLQTSTYHPNRVSPTDLSQAAQTLERYIGRHRDDMDARENLGDILARNNPQRAVEHYAAVSKRHPSREHSMVMQANLLLTQDDVETAIRDWQRIVELHPAVPSYRAKLCAALERAGRWRELKQAADLGIKDFPTTEDFYRYRVTSSLSLRETSTAEKALEILIRFHPSRETDLRGWYQGLLR